MKSEDKNLLRISENGDKSIGLYTGGGLLLSNGYNRVVFGGRGNYVEFRDDQIISDTIYIPPNQLYRLTDLRVYYVEFRSRGFSNVKVYYQLKTVAYADYKIGMFYISASDLFLDGKPILKPNTNNEKSSEFFE